MSRLNRPREAGRPVVVAATAQKVTPAEARVDRCQPLNESSPGDDIRAQLDRILRSITLRGSLRLSRFLSFVVEATLAGNADRIKAYTVAVGALGRSSDFDAQADAIVRVEAGRLRHAMARYYAGPGCDDPIVIDLPRGTYVPTFSRGAERMQTVSALKPASAEQKSRSEPLMDTAARSRQRGAALTAALTAFTDLLAAQQLQVAALAAEIASARRTLRRSRALLRAS